MTLITGFYDIGRSDWNLQFKRKSEEYIESFAVFLRYDYAMVIYMDSRYIDILKKMIDASPHGKNKILIAIDEEWMSKNIWAWSKLSREREIMNSDSYRNLIPHRIAAEYPENVNPLYTIITHSKIDFVCHAIENKIALSDMIAWIDFGYFYNKTEEKHIPGKAFDLSKFDSTAVNLCGLNQIEYRDRDALYTLAHAPEKICAYLFAATAENMKQFQSQCHTALELYQANGIADDEQALWLLCYFANIERYRIHYFPEWHVGLKHFTKN